MHKHTDILASAFQNASDVRKYLDKELANDAVLGHFQSNTFANDAYLSLLNTRDKKDSEEKRIIVNMSFPKGTASMMASKKIAILMNKS